MDGAKTYAELGIPGRHRARLVRGSHADSHAGRGGDLPRGSAIGGGALVGGEVVTLGMNWTERFEDGAWQPPRDKDVVVFLQAGIDYIPVEATERNMAGLAAIARLISPDVEDRLRQVRRLLWETRDARQAVPRTAR